LTKKRKSDLNRFQQPENNSLFSLNSAQRNVMKWGAISGVCGGFLMIQPQVLWQIIGVFIVVFVSNYHISKAARDIPRWQATVITIISVLTAMFGVIIIGAIIMANFQPVEG
jgi:uncharacterized membrane protein